VATIMVVDDAPDVLQTFEDMLTASGYSVLTARGGTEALDILDEGQSIDLLLTDVVMPGLNGFNLARMAKLRRPSLKVLYLTGKHEQTKLLRDKGLKFGKLLTKPIRMGELRHEVAAALSADVCAVDQR